MFMVVNGVVALSKNKSHNIFYYILYITVFNVISVSARVPEHLVFTNVIMILWGK